MVWNKKISDEVIIESYGRLQNVWKVAKEVGLCGQTVHERVVRLGIVNKMKALTGEERQRILKDYPKYRADARLDDLAKEMGRAKTYICMKAGELGLTDYKHLPCPPRLCKERGERQRKWIKENGHPRGMLGKTHSEKMRQEMGKRVKEAWADPNSAFNSDDYKAKHQEALIKAIKIRSSNAPRENIYSRCKRGWWTNGTKRYFMKSSWEKNYADYLDFLIKCKEIKDWEYEADTFWFEGLKRGVLSYKPDFKVFKQDGTIEYHEVKGWNDAKSQTRLKRMAKYYPTIKVELIDAKRYRGIMKNFGRKTN